MTSSTELLRRLLDERGVKWWPLGSDMTECVVDGVRIKYRQVGRGLIVSACTEGTVKPEQAIAATLGNLELERKENQKMSEYVIFSEESIREFYDPKTCSYRVPLSGKAAHDMKMLRDENEMLKIKNSNLRELVRDVVLMASCSGLKVLGMQMQAKNTDHRTIDERMRELGI
jgi:hypothetical protein